MLVPPLVVCSVLAALGSPAEPPAVEPSRPNVVVVFTDDQGWSDVGAQGAVGFATPNIDRLAVEGVRFTDGYAAQPVCSASRAALLTGCYPNRIGIHGALGPGARHGIADGELTLAELLRGEGYATAMFGKWHLGHRPRFLPTRHGFDEYYGIPYSNDMWPYHPENPEAWGDLPTLDGEEVVGYNTDQSRFTGDFTRRAVAFLRAQAAAERPFFLYVAHPMPHVPLFASEAFEGRTERGLYGDVIEEIDASVGAILDELDALGVADDTLVVYASDNGPWLSYGDHAGSAGPLREGKGTTFEGGVRVPFVVRYPARFPPGQVRHEPVMTIDVLPTVAELVGAELPAQPIDGVSLVPWLEGGRDLGDPHEALFFYYHQGDLEALRAGPWKLHFPHGYRSMGGRAPGSGGTPGKYEYGVEIGLELFDLRDDPAERRDVAADHPEVLERLQALADAARADLGDRLTEVRGAGLREPGRVPADE